MKPGSDFRDQAPLSEVRNPVSNMALGCCDNLTAHGMSADTQPVYRDFRAGDVLHNLADLSKAQSLLGYAPTHRLAQGVADAMPWYVMQSKR